MDGTLGIALTPADELAELADEAADEHRAVLRELAREERTDPRATSCAPAGDVGALFGDSCGDR